MSTLTAPAGLERYWDERAARFALTGDGLAAVCSYGMPDYHNRAIDTVQNLALRPWLRALAGRGRAQPGTCLLYTSPSPRD